MSKKHYRKLTVGNHVYQYHVGGTYVDIRPPEGTRITVSIADLKGMSQDEFERARRKRYLAVTPVDLSNFIESHACSDCGSLDVYKYAINSKRIGYECNKCAAGWEL